MKITSLICLSVLVIAAFLSICAAEESRIASIIDIKGVVEVKIAKESWKKATAGMILSQGDMIRTRKRSSVLLNLDGMGQTATVEVKQNSQLKLVELLENKKESSQTTLLDLALGEILIKAQKLHSPKSRFEVKTPTSIVGVRGTTFSVTVGAE